MNTFPDGSVMTVGNDITRLDARGTLVGQPLAIYPLWFESTPVLDEAGGFFAISGDPSSLRHYVAKYDQNGNVVTTYGDGGRAWLDFLKGYTLDGGFDLARDSAGNLYVATSRYPQPGMPEFVVAKLDRDGRPVLSFGDGGSTALLPGGKSAQAYAIAVDPSGNVYVSGLLWSEFQPVVVKFGPDGRPSASFGNGGVWTTSSCRSSLGARALAFDNAGNILVGTQCNPVAAIYKLDSSGKLLTSFGEGGVRSAVFGGVALYSILALEVATNGDVYAAGAGEVQPQTCKGDFGIAKVDTNGTPVATFGTSGLALLPVSTDYLTDIGIDAQGLIHVGGPTYSCAGRFPTRVGYTLYRLGA